MNIIQLADVIKGGIAPSTAAATVQRFFNDCLAVGTELGCEWLMDGGLTTAGAAMVIRSSVIARIDRIEEVSAIAASRGYLLPKNPGKTIMQINAGRQLGASVPVTATEAAALIEAMKDLSKIVTMYDAGTLKFDHIQPAHQLAWFEVSVDGMSTQSGDPLTDILGYQPDADFIKRKRALDALGRLDFSKRKPYLLFTADVVTDGRRQDGTVVCWMRMRDASGYEITKRDVFAVVNFPIATLTNESLQTSTETLLADENFRQVLSFYDWVDPSDVFAFVDTSTHDDTLYSFQISGFQKRAPSSPFLFDVPVNALYLSAAQAERIRASILIDLTRFGHGDDIDAVSPYPAIAAEVYGDAGYAWILAGCNVLASQRRGDSPDLTRSLSYVGSKASVILDQAATGRLFVPIDVNLIHDAVESAISSYGISQTILTALDGVGLTMFMSGKNDPLGFQPTQESLEDDTGGLAKILRAIDPSTATIDPQVLLSSLSSPMNVDPKSRYQPKVTIESDGRVLPSLPSVVGNELIDLTTYEGIARLMHLIRTVYDFYPGSIS